MYMDDKDSGYSQFSINDCIQNQPTAQVIGSHEHHNYYLVTPVTCKLNVSSQYAGLPKHILNVIGTNNQHLILKIEFHQYSLILLIAFLIGSDCLQ